MPSYVMEKSRQYWADWLRTSLVLSLVVYHASLTFTALGSTYIYRKIDSAMVLPFILLTAPLDSFFMAALFFVAGYASCFALKKRTPAQFVSERSTRLMLPVGLATALLIPVQVYFSYLHAGYHGNYFSFLLDYFPEGIFTHGWGHLWFLFYLYVFSMLCLPLFSHWKEQPHRLERISAFLTKRVNFLIPLAFIALTDAILRPLFNTGKFIIWGDWANDVLYLSFFILGHVFSSDEKLQHKVFGWRVCALCIAIPCIIVIIGLYYLDATEQFQPWWHTWLWSSLKGVYECATIVALSGYFHAHLNQESQAIRYMGKASFSYYVWHYLPVTAMTYVVLQTSLHPYVQFLLIVIPSYAFLFLFYEVVEIRLLRSLKQLLDTFRSRGSSGKAM